MRIAAYQAPLTPHASPLDRIREQVQRCEREAVTLLCCPEAYLGGLADDAASPQQCAIRTADGELERHLAPLASKFVTTIVGFTELTEGCQLHNSAVVFHDGLVAGIYRKHHPAIRRSVYTPGKEIPVFDVCRLRFGVLICNDSNDPALAAAMVARGATVLFVPTNNTLPAARADVVDQARQVDIALAWQLGVHIVRADVAGMLGDRISYGSSAIVNRDGAVIRTARRLSEDLLIADLLP